MKGNGYGYTNHQRNMRAALERAGVEITEDIEDETADCAVHITTPPSFAPTLANVPQVLFTMYECATLPPHWPGKMSIADLLVVPCQHNVRLFRSYYKGPIVKVWEGIDPEYWQFHQRENPFNPDLSLKERDRPFVFLWVGASNPRKGYEHIVRAWVLFMKRHPELQDRCVLVMKTTQDTRPPRHETIGTNVHVDTRDYPLPDLVNLYKFAHCFLFPSMGEGWGLTLHEAMATGLPSIYTDATAMSDWVPKGGGYPVKWSLAKIQTIGKRNHGETLVDHKTLAASADIEHMVRLMHRVMTRYDEALAVGRRGSNGVRQITWDRAAQEFIDKVTPHIRRTV